MSKRLIQDLHAGISRRDWQAVEMAANRLRDDVEKTVAVLAGTGIGSLPNDYPLSELAKDAINRPFGSPVESDTRLQAAAREAGWALSTLVDSIAWDKRQRVAAIIGELSLALHNPSPETRVAPAPTEARPVESQAATPHRPQAGLEERFGPISDELWGEYLEWRAALAAEGSAE